MIDLYVGDLAYYIIPVRLMTGSYPVVGAVYTDITASIKKLQQSGVGYNLTFPHAGAAGTNTTWAEISAPTNMASAGYYEISLSSSDVDTQGPMVISVKHPSADPFFVTVNVRTYSNTDIYDRIGAPAGASIAADLVLLSSSNLTRHATTQTNIAALSSSVIDRENTIISRIGTPAGASLSADLVELSSSNLTRHATTQTNIAALSSSAIDRENTIISRIGTPAGASLSADLVLLSSSNLTRHATTQTTLGTPAGASVSADLVLLSSSNITRHTTTQANIVELSSSLITRIGIPQSGSVSADIAAVRQDSYKLVNYQEGRWKIHLSGSDAGRLVLYNVDGSTALRKFTIYDVTGSNNPLAATFERIPV